MALERDQIPMAAAIGGAVEARGVAVAAPTYTVSGRDGATATAPMPVSRIESLTQVHTCPPSTVFQTPLPAVAM